MPLPTKHTFKTTIEHSEEGFCLFEADVELDCEFTSGSLTITGGRFTGSRLPLEFSKIKDGNLERFLDAKLVALSLDPEFRARVERDHRINSGFAEAAE